MKFKDLKQGYQIYLLDKSNMTFCVEKVSNVSLPHIDAKVTSTQMVVDVTTDKNTYCMSADSEVAYPLNKVVSTDKQNILREVEAIKAVAEQALAQVEQQTQTVSRCNQLIADLDPAQKEKQATEARFASIETSIQEMMSMLKKIAD